MSVVCLTASMTFAANDPESYGINYKIDDVAIDQMFAQSEDVTLTLTDQLSSLSMINTASFTALPEGVTVGGFLLRAYFCGAFALHRSYMGTDGQSLFANYCCLGFIPIACIDFWRVVFDKERLEEYVDNPKWIVWSK